MTERAVGGTEFRIGGVLGRSVSILFKNIVSFGLVAIVLTSPPTIYEWVTINSEASADLAVGSWMSAVSAFGAD